MLNHQCPPGLLLLAFLPLSSTPLTTSFGTMAQRTPAPAQKKVTSSHGICPTTARMTTHLWKVSTPPPVAHPLPNVEQVGHWTQLSEKQYRTQATYGMQVWPIHHKMKRAEELQRRCLSEPPPKTNCHHLAPLTCFTVWVAPWGETIHMVSNQVLHKKAWPSQKEWTDNYRVWQVKLPQ